MSENSPIRCPSCGVTNRVPLDRAQRGERPVCGRCRAPMPVSTRPMTVTDATFEAEVERSSVPVLLDLWAEWCGPCRVVGPMVEQLAAEMAGVLRVAKLNVEENPATAARFRVRSIPTLLVLKEGREVDRIVGAQSKSDIARRLRRAIT